MSEISKRLRNYVNDYEVADHYGAWGILRRDQRRQIRELCDFCDSCEAAADEFGRELIELRQEVERLKAEAVKEFVQKLKKEIEEECASIHLNTCTYYAVDLRLIDDVEEEFAEGKIVDLHAEYQRSLKGE